MYFEHDNMVVGLRRGYHPVYDELIADPPKGVTYKLGALSSSNRSSRFNWLLRSAWSKYLEVMGKPHSIYVDTPDVDLIHSCAGTLPTNKQPWVVDAEHAMSFVGFNANRLSSRVGKNIDKMISSDYCKSVMAWSEAGKASMLSHPALTTDSYVDKINVVYPGIRIDDAQPIQFGGPTKFLFVSQRFETKGGPEVCEAFEHVHDAFPDSSLTMVSTIKEGSSLTKSDYPSVNFTGALPREKLLNEVYPTHNAFVLPSYMDTFGMVYLEAMKYSHAVIGSNCFAVPEILAPKSEIIDVAAHCWYDEEGQFAFDTWDSFCEYCDNMPKPDVVDSLIDSMSRLAKDWELRKEQGQSSFDTVTTKFSSETRNHKLYNEYAGAVHIGF